MRSICETLKPAEPAGGQDERRISRAAAPLFSRERGHSFGPLCPKAGAQSEGRGFYIPAPL